MTSLTSSSMVGDKNNKGQSSVNKTEKSNICFDKKGNKLIKSPLFPERHPERRVRQGLWLWTRSRRLLGRQVGDDEEKDDDFEDKNMMVTMTKRITMYEPAPGDLSSFMKDDELKKSWGN